MYKFFHKLVIISIYILLIISLLPQAVFAAVPSTPTSLTATSMSANQIDLTWSAASNASYYNIYRSTSYYDSYSLIGTESSLGHIDASLSAGITYYYKVQAVNSDGASSFSSVASATTAFSSSYLTAAASGSSQIYLFWPTISEAYYYNVTRSTSYSGTYTTVAATSSAGYTDTGLSSNVTYYYRVQALNSSGTSIYYSSIASATTSSAITDLTATASGASQINLSWPTVSGASYYYVTRSTSYSGTYSLITTTSSLSYTDTGLSSGTTYYYKVQALNSLGTSYYSLTASATTSSSSIGLTATASGSSQIYLSWPGLSGSSYYQIYRAPTYSGTFSLLTTTSSTSYTNSSLSSATAYYYRIQAVNSSGSTLYTSTIASATTFSSGSSAQLTSDRLAGDNRYETSCEISQSGWTSSKYAVVVSGENYPDALCSTPLAAKYSAPILLTSKDNLNTETRDELQRLDVEYVFLIGGTGVISSSTEKAIHDLGISITRFAGTDRYDTSLRIAEAIGSSTEAVIVNGTSFADALSIASIAGIKKIPILLTPASSMSTALKNYLQNHVETTYVIGGTEAISNNLFNQLPSPHRISGTNRYFTNVDIIKYFSSQMDMSTCYLATGQSFPDALAGSALASLKRAPIVLVNSPLTNTTQTFFEERVGTISKAIVFGGTSVIPNTIFTNISATTSSTGTLSTPNNLTAASLSGSQIYLSWSSVSAATSYYIYRATSYSGTYSYLASTSSVAYTDTGLSTGTTYYYKVTAVNSSGSSSYSSIAYAITSSVYPSTPSSLSASPYYTNQIYLSWSSASNASTYYIYRSTSYYGTYSYLDSTSYTYYTDTGLSTGTTYYYKVMAVNSTGYSDYSSIAYATATTTGYPSAPTGLSATALGSSQIYLSWTASSYATYYYIYRATSYGGSYSAIGTSMTTYYTDTGLSSATYYYYKILAYNDLGSSTAYSSIASAVTNSSVSVPSAPSGLTATAVSGASQINLSWTAVSGAISYTVARSDSSGGTFSAIATGLTNTSYSDTSGQSNTTYYYKVLASNSAGPSTYSSEVSALTAPAAPTVTATPSGTTITLSWTAVPGVAQYDIYQAATSGGTYSYYATVTAAAFTDAGLMEGTSYYYKVKSVNSAGTTSAYSAAASATTVPPKPGDLHATADSNSEITLTWSAVSGGSTYTVYRSATELGTYTEIASGLTVLTYTDTGLSANTTYYYKIVALNAAGSSAESDASSAMTDN